MSEPSEPDQGAAQGTETGIAGEEEIIDALPVPDRASVGVVAQPVGNSLQGRLPSGPSIPAVQAAAVAAGSFVAGAAVVSLVHRRQRRSRSLSAGTRAGRALGAGGSRGGSRAGELLQIVASRSLLVDVHLLGGSGGDR